MTLIPTVTLERWHVTARRNALVKLEMLLEFRAMMPDFKAENVLMEAYKEAAEAMLISPETLRDDMGKIREYQEEQLRYWIDNGVSFDHMEKAAQLAEIAHKTPARLLDECIDPGNANGDTMTVKELIAFALGEKPKPRHTLGLVVMFDRLRKFPTNYGWDIEKTTRFTSWLDAGKEFLA